MLRSNSFIHLGALPAAMAAAFASFAAAFPIAAAGEAVAPPEIITHVRDRYPATVAWGWDAAAPGRLAARFLAIGGVGLGELAFADAERLFGAVKRYRLDRRSKARSLEAAMDFICYLPKGADGDVAVVFESGIMGDWNIITSVWVGRPDYVDTGKCSESGAMSAQDFHLAGLFLDSGWDDVERIVGAPVFHEGRNAAYRHERPCKVLEYEYDELSGLEFHFSRVGGVDWFRIYLGELRLDGLPEFDEEGTLPIEVQCR